MLPCLLNIKEDKNDLPLCFVWRILFKKSIIDNHNITFDERTRKWEDRDYIIEYLRFAKTVVFFDEPLYTYMCLGTGTNLGASYYPNVVFERIDKVEYREKLFKETFDFNTDYYNMNFSVIVGLLSDIVNHEEETVAKEYIEKLIKNDFVISLAKRATRLKERFRVFRENIIECSVDKTYVELQKIENKKEDVRPSFKMRVRSFLKNTVTKWLH